MALPALICDDCGRPMRSGSTRNPNICRICDRIAEQELDNDQFVRTGMYPGEEE